MSNKKVSRRKMLTLTGGAGAAALAGCIEGLAGGEQADSPLAAEAYVVPYHWGFAVFGEDGEELDKLEIDTGTELTIHAVNDHAHDAVESLPDPVTEAVKDMDPLARTKEKVESGELPEPEDGTVEEMYDKAHGRGHDDGHGHDDEEDHHGDDGHDDDDDDGHGHDGDDDGHDHDDALLDHGFMIQGTDINVEVAGDAEEQATASEVLEEPGTYDALCTIHCGFGHTEQQAELVEVND